MEKYKKVINRLKTLEFLLISVSRNDMIKNAIKTAFKQCLNGVLIAFHFPRLLLCQRESHTHSIVGVGSRIGSAGHQRLVYLQVIKGAESQSTAHSIIGRELQGLGNVSAGSLSELLFYFPNQRLHFPIRVIQAERQVVAEVLCLLSL